MSGLLIQAPSSTRDRALARAARALRAAAEVVRVAAEPLRAAAGRKRVGFLAPDSVRIGADRVSMRISRRARPSQPRAEVSPPRARASERIQIAGRNRPRGRDPGRRHPGAVAPPRVPLVRHHGLLATSSSWRALVVTASEAMANGPSCTHAHLTPRSSNVGSSDEQPAGTSEPAAATVARERGPSMPEPPAPRTPEPNAATPVGAVVSSPGCAQAPTERTWRRCTSCVDWASLAGRTFGIDVLECPRCHQGMHPVAVITRREVVDRILSIRLCLAYLRD
jgi:hypothetical protein